MHQLVLTPEQFDAYRNATDDVELRDPEGNLLAVLAVHDNRFYRAEIERWSPSKPGRSGKSVQAMLRHLDNAWRREGSFDQKRMRELIREFDFAVQDDA